VSSVRPLTAVALAKYPLAARLPQAPETAEYPLYVKLTVFSKGVRTSWLPALPVRRLDAEVKERV